MLLEISPYQLKQLWALAAALGAQIALVRTGQLKPYLSKAEAYRLYGRKNIEAWIREGMLTPRKDGDHSASWRLDRIEAETIVHAIKAKYIL
ncbi:hypothetical protein [Mucilaginibacter sp. UYCu711]|uniref:hypothetical protein n=1 Tax=Mucilaginibacter sp. UYCu711 TaxID=3156339 RepID=UPI003D22E0CE